MKRSGATSERVPEAVPERLCRPAPGSAHDTSANDQINLLAQHIDEAALLFATQQAEAAARLLDASLSDPPAHASETERRAWFLLLELHQALGAQTSFDRAAIAYAQRFEASPPQWRAARHGLTTHTPGPPLSPPVLLSAGERLDAGAQPALAQWRLRSATRQSVALDLAPVAHIDLTGCRLLLALLADWQQRGVQLQLKPCEPLLAQLHALIQAGRRDEDDAGWRLLIELLRLAGDVERYENACLAYSLTYEMSPPVAPPALHPFGEGNDRSQPLARTVTADDRTAAQAQRNRVAHAAFTLPETISMPVESCLLAIREHVQRTAAGSQALVLDASRLVRIDFAAAGALQAGLRELAGDKTVEWQGVSFLVSTLLHLTCGSGMPRIINRTP